MKEKNLLISDFKCCKNQKSNKKKIFYETKKFYLCSNISKKNDINEKNDISSTIIRQNMNFRYL
jgi:hypothetical protein